MDKETILQMSRAENEGKQDEREQFIEDKSSLVGRNVGLFLCIVLVLLSEHLLHNRDVGRGAWLVFFAMEGCSELYRYLQNKKTSKLIWCVVELFCAVYYLTAMIILALR